MLIDPRAPRGRRPKAAREGKRGGKGSRINLRYGDLVGACFGSASTLPAMSQQHNRLVVTSETVVITAALDAASG
jgi:hypothetical protein